MNSPKETEKQPPSASSESSLSNSSSLLDSRQDPQKPPSQASLQSSEANLNQPGKSSAISLKRLAIRGSAWVMFGFGIGQILRLGGNIILTRFLSPEAFGIMGLASALLNGLGMFSDVGLRPNIIQSKRGEDPAFLCTAWTVQIIRGFILALLAAALAWPLAFLNEEPRLILIVTVAGLTSAISGFDSISLLVHSRHMFLGRLISLNLIGSAFGLIGMVTWAWYSPTVWALVVGGFVGSTIKLVASHTILAGIPMRFRWEPEAVHELITFGRWIFISTALGFLVARLDIFIFGGVAGMSMLGLYVLAKNFSLLIIQALRRLSSMVLLPVYSRLAERSPKVLRNKTFKVRAALLAVSLPPLWILILGGGHIVNFLYDERYYEAGWMLQILAAGATATAISVTIYPMLLALGDSFRHMLVSLTRITVQVLGMMIGGYIAGLPGFIVGIAITDFLSYPVMVYFIRPYGVWLPWLDAAAFGSSFFVIGVAWWIS